MANVIIGIHGLGNKPDKRQLEHWWKQAMIEGLKTNSYKSILPKFELVYWADIRYDKPLSEYEEKSSPYFLEEVYTKGSDTFPTESHNTRKKLIDFIRRQMNHLLLNKDYSLNYSGISDALIAKYFKDLDAYYKEDCTPENASSCNVKDLINKRLTETLIKYKNDNIMLVSHSMGSIIAFEVLNFELTDSDISTFVTMGSPLGLPVIISKIAAEQKQISNEETHMNTPPPVSGHWYNFSDILDKVAFNYKLSDDFTDNKHRVSPVDFLVVNNYEIKGKKNPHKSFGYLRTAEFAKILNDFIAAEKLNFVQKVNRKVKQAVQYLKAERTNFR